MFYGSLSPHVMPRSKIPGPRSVPQRRWPPSSVKSSTTPAPGAKASGCWALAAMRETSARPGGVAATVAMGRNPGKKCG